MTLRIWYISKYAAFPDAKRGGSRGYRLMRELVRRGVECTIFTSDSNHLTDITPLQGERRVRDVDGVAVCWLRTYKYSGARSIKRVVSWFDFEWRLLKLPKQQFGRPDVVIASSLSLLSVISGLWFKWRYRSRLIFEIRDIWPLTLVEEGGFIRWHPFILFLAMVERIGLRLSDAIVGTMPNLREHVIAVSGRRDGVFTIPFGIDEEMIENADEADGEWIDRHLPRNRFIVCHAGTIGTTNALETVLECAALMRDAPVHFLFVGEGDLRARYIEQTRDLPNVSFTGPVPKAQVQAVVERCDIAYFSTFPSPVWRYGMSLNKVIDYMLAERPILGSYSGYPTMIDDAECGTTVPAGDVVALRAEILRYMHMTPAERSEIGRRGRAWLLQHRTYSKLADDYLAILQPDDSLARVPAPERLSGYS